MHYFICHMSCKKYNERMAKETALSVRVTRALKSDLEKIALNEGRSVAQVCEALLNGGLDAYRKEGSSYLQRFITRKRRTGRNAEA
jgi:hypothetical protein